MQLVRPLNQKNASLYTSIAMRHGTHLLLHLCLSHSEGWIERETMSHVRFGHQRGRLRLRSRLASSNSDKNDHGSLAKTRTSRRSRGVVVQDRLEAECDHREYSDHVLQIPTIFEPFLEWPKFYNFTNYCPEGKGFARS